MLNLMALQTILLGNGRKKNKYKKKPVHRKEKKDTIK